MKIFHLQSSQNYAIELFTEFIPSAIAPISKITIRLNRWAEAVLAAPK
ncbi:MAG: hypothetical protein RM368_22530 [Nostoc sp. DedSLP03]|nr:hypothetical protein [Nostoc sp. DedSLP03]MDZ7967695.1 hypothetical protein [Nostoc sp. DedSLP03]